MVRIVYFSEAYILRHGTVYFQRKDRKFSKFQDRIFSQTVYSTPTIRIFPVLGPYIYIQDRILYS